MKNWYCTCIEKKDLVIRHFNRYDYYIFSKMPEEEKSKYIIIINNQEADYYCCYI